jgi:alpha-amylase/alpha-mannosidase (GH57 family)
VRYRPHIATYGDDSIVVIVRDRELSDAQESGMEYSWFLREVEERTRWCDFPPLVTTCTDGENGGWFRNTNMAANFWGAFYAELLEHTKSVGLIQPTFITDYLNRFGAHGEVHVKTGAWNTGWHHGRDFTQWTGSQSQRDALVRVNAVSQCVNAALGRTAPSEAPVADIDRQALDEAWWRLLRAETSCNFYWGEEWVQRCHLDLDACVEALKRCGPR